MTDVAKYINILSNRLKRRSKKIENMLGITSGQGSILRYIMLESSMHKIYQKDIEKEFGLRPPTATELLHALEQKELICRGSDEGDARLKRIQITEKAQKMKEVLLAEICKNEEDLVRGIEPELIEQFVETAKRMIMNLSE